MAPGRGATRPDRVAHPARRPRLRRVRDGALAAVPQGCEVTKRLRGVAVHFLLLLDQRGTAVASTSCAMLSLWLGETAAFVSPIGTVLL